MLDNRSAAGSCHGIPHPMRCNQISNRRTQLHPRIKDKENKKHKKGVIFSVYSSAQPHCHHLLEEMSSLLQNPSEAARHSWPVHNPHIILSSSSLLIQMFRVPSAGPGCAHFMTCSTCLKAPRFMNCGWCSGICSRRHECTSQWNEVSCAPVITEVLTICC